MRKSILLLLVVILFSACASNNGMVRKCDGKRGTRVPMGTL